MNIKTRQCCICDEEFEPVNNEIVEGIHTSNVCDDCWKLSKLCFGLVNEIRQHNKDEIAIYEYFDAISENRRQYLYQNIKAVLDNPSVTAKDMHNEWAKVRIDDGWQFGIETDRANKVHDCLVEFDELNVYQKLKDHVVVETIKMYCKL